MINTATMLRLLLACAERPGDMRLNSHLSESDIAETIRIAIECLETEQAQTAESERLRAVLVGLSRAAIATDSPEFVAIPATAWQTLLDSIVSRETR